VGNEKRIRRNAGLMEVMGLHLSSLSLLVESKIMSPPKMSASSSFT
jgi:hypothetical protein